MAKFLNLLKLRGFTSPSDAAVEISATTDSASASRLRIDAGGKLTWGDGTNAGDTNLYRTVANTLKTDDYLVAEGGLTIESYQVTTVGASAGNALVFDGTKFAPAAVSGGGAAGSTYVATIGNGSATTITVTHGLNTRDVVVVVRNANSPYEVIDVQWEATSTSTVTFNFGTPPASNSVRVGIYSATTGDNVVLSLDNLTDVVITAPEEFQTLEYNGTNWVNQYASVVSYVRNAEATTITTGTCVYLFGSTGDHATVKRASNTSDVTSSKTIGVAGVNIAASQNGPIITRGYVDGIDLSTGYTAGDVLWLGTNGQFTKTKPTAPDHLVFIGVVVRATNNGIIYVATQNGYELDELHNVSLPSPQSGEFLKYNGSLWVADAIDLGTDTTGNYVASVSAGTGVSVSGTSGEGSFHTISIGQSVGTSDSPSFAGLTVGGSVPAFYATMASSRVGIGTNTPSPSAQLTVKSTSTSYAPLVIQNASGQSASSQEWQNAMGSVLAYVSSTGDIFSYSTVTGASVSGWAIAQGGELASDTNLTLLYGTGGGSSPTQNASINVKRGISPTVAIRWNETTDKWQFTNDGTTYKDLGSGGITVSDTAPSTPATGDLWYESDTGSTYVYYDSYWIEIGGSTAYDQIIGTIQAKGDLLAGTASQAIARLAVGTNGTRLVADSTTATGLAWASDTQNTVIDAKGDLLVGLADNTVGKLTVGSNGQILVADSSQTTGVGWAAPPPNFRNALINGGFQIDQRNVGGVQTIIAGFPLTYTADRWYAYCTGANVTGQQIAGAAPFQNYYRFNGAAANTAVGFGQRIEASNSFHFAGQTATLSAFLASTTLTTVTWTMFYANIPNTFGTLASPTRTQIATGTFTINSTLTRYQTSVSIPAAATTGIEVVFTTGAFTSGTLTFAGAQLELGAAALPFEVRPYGVELQLCQRYYEKTYDLGLNPGSATNNGFVGVGGPDGVASTYFFSSWRYKVEKRTSPTVTVYDTSGNSGKITTWQSGGTTHNVTPSNGNWVNGTNAHSVLHQGSVAGWFYQAVSSAEL